MSARYGTSTTATVAMAAAAFMIADQVAGKATRDALFLSSFEVESLPTMLIGASLLSGVSVVLSARVMTRLSPTKLIPPTFAISALLLLFEWQLATWSPRLGEEPESEKKEKKEARSREDILEQLMKSNQSIEISLQQILGKRD